MSTLTSFLFVLAAAAGSYTAHVGSDTECSAWQRGSPGDVFHVDTNMPAGSGGESCDEIVDDDGEGFDGWTLFWVLLICGCFCFCVVVSDNSKGGARLQTQEAMAKQQEAATAAVVVASTPSARGAVVPAEIDGDAMHEKNPNCKWQFARG